MPGLEGKGGRVAKLRFVKIVSKMVPLFFVAGGPERLLQTWVYTNRLALCLVGRSRYRQSRQRNCAEPPRVSPRLKIASSQLG